MSQLIQIWPIRIYYEDTDHGGVVYYANYLKFMERARTEFLRAAGLELDHIASEYGLLFAVCHADIHYQQPARFNDLLQVHTALTTLRRAQVSFQQHIYRHKQLLCNADIHLAAITVSEGRASRIPRSVAGVLRQHVTSITSLGKL